MATSITATWRMTMSLFSAGTSERGASYSTRASVSSTRTTGITYRPTALIFVNDSSTCQTSDRPRHHHQRLVGADEREVTGADAAGDERRGVEDQGHRGGHQAETVQTRALREERHHEDGEGGRVQEIREPQADGGRLVHGARSGYRGRCRT